MVNRRAKSDMARTTRRKYTAEKKALQYDMVYSVQYLVQFCSYWSFPNDPAPLTAGQLQYARDATQESLLSGQRLTL